MFCTKMIPDILKRFVRCDSGATAIEYGLIAGLIGVSIIGGAGATGDSLGAKFSEISAYLAEDAPRQPPRGRPGS